MKQHATILVSITIAVAISYFLSISQPMESVESSKILRLNAPLGQFLLRIDEKVKNEKGHAIRFSVGNENYAQYQKVRVQVSWGKKNPNSEGKIALNTQAVILDKLPAGKWTSAEVTIPVQNEADMQIINFNIVGAENIALMAE